MRVPQMSSSLLPRLSGHRSRPAHHVKAGGFYHCDSNWPVRRFSARLDHARWCANLRQNPGHHSTHVSRAHPVATPFPRPGAGLAMRGDLNQRVHGARHDQAPAFKLLRGTYMHLCPAPVLFEKAGAVFVLLLAHPDKPAFARIAFAPVRYFPQGVQVRSD